VAATARTCGRCPARGEQRNGHRSQVTVRKGFHPTHATESEQVAMGLALPTTCLLSKKEKQRMKIEMGGRLNCYEREMESGGMPEKF
jgi:hypothetical protein